MAGSSLHILAAPQGPFDAAEELPMPSLLTCCGCASTPASRHKEAASPDGGGTGVDGAFSRGSCSRRVTSGGQDSERGGGTMPSGSSAASWARRSRATRRSASAPSLSRQRPQRLA
ncbi:hypothetical protein TcCL_Unassigned02718 [Trypanosoma cruzi]|nr:hypothetical protein TcCL_Unassigned02718 [Trypanosoma cruzi]